MDRWVGEINKENLISSIERLEMSRLSHLPSLENFTVQLLHLAFFHQFVFTSISNIILWADFFMGQLCYMPSGFGCLSCLFILSNTVFSV